MDEGRKAPASCAGMCFPGRLNEAGSIKGVNQSRGCLGSTWAGLLMRQKQSWISKAEPEMFCPEDGSPRGCLISGFAGWS